MKTKQIGNHWVVLESGWITINSLEGVLKKLSLACQDPMFFQLVDATILVSEHHVWTGAALALQAIEQKHFFSKKPELEFLVRVSGQRQIEKALARLSLKEGKQQSVALVGVGLKKETLQKEAKKLGRSLGIVPAPDLFSSKKTLEHKDLILESFGILSSELAVFSHLKTADAIEALVLEKMALLSLEA